ncbi:MAG: AAA family ATPase [Myxococcota bacterium]|jgi:exonuclease SbcC|nr:AAA family ATPase [Myxococcota bacterium]
MIESIRVRNFRRLKEATLQLGAGVHFIEGPNNAGKTSLFYAIEYALFGRVNGVPQLSALLHPKAKGFGVELVFLARDQRRYRLQRAHLLPPRSRTKLSGHFTLKCIDEQAERYICSSDFGDHEELLALRLSELLGISRRVFDAAIFLKQGQIAAVLEGAAGLDIVFGITAAIAVADELRAMANERLKAAESLPVLEGSLQRLEDDRANGKARAQALEARRAECAASLSRLDERLQALQTEQAKLQPLLEAKSALARALSNAQSAERSSELVIAEQTRFAEDNGDRDSLSTRQAEASERETQAAVALEQARKQELQLLETRRQLDGQLAELSGRRQRRQSVASQASCEYCGAPIDAAHAQRDLDLWQAELDGIQAQLQALEAQLQAARQAGVTENQRRLDAALAAKDCKAKLERDTELQQRLERATRQRSETHDALLQVCQDTADQVQALLDEGLESSRFETVMESLADDSLPQREEALRLLSLELAELNEALIEKRGVIRSEHSSLSQQERSRREEQSELGKRLESVEKEYATVSMEVQRLRQDRALAERLRRLSDGFKSLQVLLRDLSSEALAKETAELHRRLSVVQGEFEGLRIDPSNYVLHITPKDLAQDVPAHMAQGGGQQLLLGIAFKLAVAKLVGPCPFVLLDEPTYGLDRSQRDGLLERIQELGVTQQVLLITHQRVGSLPAHRVQLRREKGYSVLESEGVV